MHIYDELNIHRFQSAASEVDYPNILSPKPSQTLGNNNNIAQYVMTFLYGLRYLVCIVFLYIGVYGIVM